MALAQHSQPLWEAQEFLGLIPGLVACISLLLLVSQQFCRCVRPKPNMDYLLSIEVEGAIDGGFLTVVEQSRPLYRDLLEVLLIVGAIILNALKLDMSQPSSGALIGLITWVYDMILAALHLILTPRWEIPNVRGHLTVIYASQQLTQVLSATAQSSLSQIFTIIECSLTLLLLIIAATSRNYSGASPQEVEDGLQPSREPQASLFSKITFSWIGSLAWKGYRKSLNMDDLCDLDTADKAFAVLKSYREPKEAGNLLWHLLHHFRFSILKQWICSSLSVLFGFASILILKAILECIEHPYGVSGNVMWQYVVLLPLTGIIQTLIDQQSLWAGYKGCLRMRALLQDKIYAKTLRRRASADDEDRSDDKNDKRDQADTQETSSAGGDDRASSIQASVGTITSLMHVDATKISDTISWIHESISVVPLQVMGCTILLWHIIGPSFIPGFIFLICFMFINIWFSRSISEAQKGIMVARDERIRVTNETLQIIRMIKIWAWERYFLGLVSEKRSTELGARRYLFSMQCRRMLSRDMASFMINFVSFLIYTIIKGKPLYPSVAFGAIGLFDKLKESLDKLVEINIQFREVLIANGRVQSFLNEPETEMYRQPCVDTTHAGADEVVGFSNASFRWNPTSAFVLKDLNVEFAVGELNLVAGPTGSGKTSLLLSLLGELTQVGGALHMSECDNNRRDPQAEPARSVAYCAQQPWLLNTSVRDNILFGCPMDEERYRDVLVACALNRDLGVLDQTSVGERGVKLSGGQKQRVAIARALYSGLPLVLLDDCLSSLDAHTAQLVFQGITGPLMYKRTCILVSHDIRLCLLRSYFVVFLENGKIAAQGTPQDVITAGKFVGLDKDISCSSTAPPIEFIDGLPSREGTAQITTTKDTISRTQEVIISRTRLNALSLYLQSIDMWWFWPSGVVVIVLRSLTGLASNIWVRLWASRYLTSETLSTQDMQIPRVDTNFYLIGYALFGVCEALVNYFHNWWTSYGSIFASSRIHDRLLKSVCGAKFSVFDSIPYGQFMNRFSADLDCVDGEVAFRTVSVKDDASSLVIGIVLISSVIPGFLPVAVFISAMYLLIGVFYLESSRDLRRLDADEKSKLFQQLNEAVTGMVTIRAFGEEDHFMKDNRQLMDTYHRPWIDRCALNRLFAVCMGLVSAMVTLSTGVFISLRVNAIDSGSAGLILKYALMFTHLVSCLVRDYMKMEQTNIPVERIQACSNVEQEKETMGSRIATDADWPKEGSIAFENFTARYGEAPQPVLSHISFNINPKEKIGVVGHTGAGKSSLALALIRGLPAEEGKILIDGHEIDHVSLQTLRESIAFVPQDATLFRGHIRSNLDPFNAYTDGELLDALHCVGMVPTQVKKDFLYSSEILSHGQRQLVCLARAFLKDLKVLMMDEATASVDYEIDAKIQAAIGKLRNTTIITIAHRLSTVIDYDKVLVLDQGKVMEFEHPYTLLRSTNGTGLFREMCQKAGNFEELERAAKKAYEVRRLVDDELGLGL